DALFCVHPAGGLSWCYAPLLRYLPDDIPLYGLQATGLDGTGELPESLPAMAADYLQRLRSVQPSGPYRLLGWSFGGLVAHEMARQLQAQGEQVAAMIVLDAYPPTGSIELDAGTAAQLAELVRQAAGPYAADAAWASENVTAVVWNN